MRIMIEGAFTKARLLQVIDDVFAREPSLAMMRVFEMSFYPRDARDRRFTIQDSEGNPIEGLRYREHRRNNDGPVIDRQQSEKSSRPKAQKPVLRLVQNNAPVSPQATPNAA